MDTALELGSLFQLFAAFNAALLGLTALCGAAVKCTPATGFGGFSLLLVGGVLSTISLDHAGFSFALFDLHIVESILTLAAGPLILGLILALHARRAPVTALFGPPVVYVAIVGTLAGLDHRLLFVPTVVFIQFAYTLAAWLVHGLSSTSGSDREKKSLAFWVLVAMSVVHSAQVLRMTGPDIAAMTNVVPIVMGALLLALTSRIFWSGGPAFVSSLSRKPAVAATGNRELVVALQALIERHQIHLDRELHLSNVAEALDVTPKALSAEINACTGQSFSRYIMRERINHAKRLLSSPDEQRTSVEAVALMSGFHSRSAFYRAFRAETGTSPAAFRQMRENGR